MGNYGKIDGTEFALVEEVKGGFAIYINTRERTMFITNDDEPHYFFTQLFGADGKPMIYTGLGVTTKW